MEDRERRNLDAARPHRRPMRYFPAICLKVLMAASLGSCASDGLDLFGSAKPDRSISTSAVSAQKTDDAISDEATVRNAVTSADMAKIGPNPIPWANASTGSAGVITAVQEDASTGTRCRAFRTTRHSYMGIAKFMGRTCMESNGNWQLLSFQEEQG